MLPTVRKLSIGACEISNVIDDFKQGWAACMAHHDKIRLEREKKEVQDFLNSFKKNRGNTYDAACLIKKACKTLGLVVPDYLEVLKDMKSEDFDAVMHNLEKEPEEKRRRVLWTVIRIYTGLTHAKMMTHVGYMLVDIYEEINFK